MPNQITLCAKQIEVLLLISDKGPQLISDSQWAGAVKVGNLHVVNIQLHELTTANYVLKTYRNDNLEVTITKKGSAHLALLALESKGAPEDNPEVKPESETPEEPPPDVGIDDFRSLFR